MGARWKKQRTSSRIRERETFYKKQSKMHTRTLPIAPFTRSEKPQNKNHEWLNQESTEPQINQELRKAYEQTSQAK